jgi:hypothetical protein
MTGKCVVVGLRARLVSFRKVLIIVLGLTHAAVVKHATRLAKIDAMKMFPCIVSAFRMRRRVAGIARKLGVNRVMTRVKMTITLRFIGGAVYRMEQLSVLRQGRMIAICPAVIPIH